MRSCKESAFKTPFLAGGVAHNRCLQRLLAEELGVLPTVPENPQTVGALGAALYAAQQLQQLEQSQET